MHRNKQLITLFLLVGAFVGFFGFSQSASAATQSLPELKLKWVDASTIESTEKFQNQDWSFGSPKTSGKNIVFSRSNDPDAGNPTGNPCADQLTITGPVTTTDQFSKGTLVMYTYSQGDGGCVIADKGNQPYTQGDGSIAYSVSVTNVDNAQRDAGTGDAAVATDGANGAKETIPCEGGIPGLGWLICLVAKGADAFVANLETSINSLLSVPPESYGEGASAANNGDVNGLKTAWSAVRIIASLLLVGVALFMVLSQIFSFDFVSAYTVKKVLPKLVIATILIQLSWLLFTSFIQVVDTISLGLRDLLFAPFGGKDQVTITQILSDFYSKNGAVGAQASVAGISLIASTAGIAAIGGGFGLLAAAIGVLLAVLTAFVTLVIRKVIIIVLLVLSPLALVAWILPNTQKLWSTWWQLFSKLTLMFPLIVLLLASGKIFAYLTAQQNTGGWLAFYIIIVAYFGPLFLIPATFKFAGSLFGKIGSTIGGAGDKFKASDPFDFKKKSELTNSKLARKSRQADYARSRNSAFADRVSGTGLRSRYTRYRSADSKEGRERIASAAYAGQISEAQKDLANSVGGDYKVLNAIARGAKTDAELAAAGVRSDEQKALVRRYSSDSQYQAAALTTSAGMGKAETGDFRAVAKALQDKPAFAGKVIGDAAYAAKKAGDTTNGTLLYDYSNPGNVTGGTVDDVVKEVRKFTAEDYGKLAINKDSATPELLDPNVAEALRRVAAESGGAQVYYDSITSTSKLSPVQAQALMAALTAPPQPPNPGPAPNPGTGTP